jgi:hypothetical protein
LLLRDNFELPFVQARIPELEESIRTTSSSLQPLQAATARIQNDEALQHIDKAEAILQSLNQLYIAGIETLQEARVKKGEEAEKTRP